LPGDCPCVVPTHFRRPGYRRTMLDPGEEPRIVRWRRHAASAFDATIRAGLARPWNE
jgi:hypothetical protein